MVPLDSVARPCCHIWDESNELDEVCVDEGVSLSWSKSERCSEAEMRLTIQVHIPSNNSEVQNINLEVNLMEFSHGCLSELLLCWFLHYQHRICQHLHKSEYHKRRLKEIYRGCNWSEYRSTFSQFINLDYGIWTKSLNS